MNPQVYKVLPTCVGFKAHQQHTNTTYYCIYGLQDYISTRTLVYRPFVHNADALRVHLRVPNPLRRREVTGRGGPAEEAGHLAPQLVDLLPRGEAGSKGVGGRRVARLFRRSLSERRSRLRLQRERALNLRVPLVPVF